MLQKLLGILFALAVLALLCVLASFALINEEEGANWDDDDGKDADAGKVE